MAVEIVGSDRVPSPGQEIPSPGASQSRYSSGPDLSPLDTPRKNKRKLSEPKRRTTDFSIKRLCPDRPGSACSESGHSEESGSERARREPCESPEDQDSSRGTPTDIEVIPPHLKPHMVFPNFNGHPYFIPPWYYSRLPGLSAGDGVPYGAMPGVSGMSGLNGMASASGLTGMPSGSGTSGLNSIHSHGSSTSAGVPQFSAEGSSRIEADVSQCSPDDDDGRDSPSDMSKDGKKCRKNYKNMTRERRVEANARERSRVHTISAAFDGLRRAVPSYSYNQKLSKLAILRIACSYILALSKLAETDDEPSLKNTTFSECVDNCTRTIQTEGKARRRLH